MHDITLALAILLISGFLVAKLGQLINLPSVTGYICAGLLLGPAGFKLITVDTIGSRLEHFTQIALMLIAFGIGEHLEIKRLKPIAKSVLLIGFFETSCTFVAVMFGSFIIAKLTSLVIHEWNYQNYIALCILLGAVAVATAPAATLHVMRELKASGPLTSTLLAVVAVDDGLAIMFFGITVSIVHHVFGAGGASIYDAISGSFYEIFLSLLLGIVTGMILDFIVQKLEKKEEMLTIALALLLVCGEIARLTHLSPLLAGMSAGFTIINRDHRDVRVFREINAFEPPIYVLFFTLAGAHLQPSLLLIAGWIGLAYFFSRIAGKITGSYIGARLAGAPEAVQKYLGLALLPQAGVAIGLVFLIQGDGIIAQYSSIITPVVLAGVVLSEITGPVCARIAVTKANEANYNSDSSDSNAQKDEISIFPAVNKFQLVKWTWENIIPPKKPDGVVMFGVSHPGTVAGLARMATLLSVSFNSKILAVKIEQSPTTENFKQQYETNRLFKISAKEVKTLGAELHTKRVYSEGISEGLIAIAGMNNTRCILLGHPSKGTSLAFKRVVEAVAEEVPCQVIVARFVGVLHTERIFVPVTERNDLIIVKNTVKALAQVGNHSITVLRLMDSEAGEEELKKSLEELKIWAREEDMNFIIDCRIQRSESRLDTILAEAAKHDLIIIPSKQSSGLTRLFFGSLAEDVVQHTQKSILLVHGNP